MFDGFSQLYRENARLAILRSLAEQTDYRLSDSMLCTVLQTYAINRGRDFVRAELSWLESEAGAVKLLGISEIVIAELTEAGLDHVQRRRVLPGIKRPDAIRG